MKRIYKQMLARGECEAVMRAMKIEKEGKPMSFFDDIDPERASNAWPDGSYEATITKVDETRSKANQDPMLVVHITVYGGPAGPTKNQRIEMKEYITDPAPETGRKGSLWKLRAITEATGLYDKFKAKTLRGRDLVDKNVMVKLAKRYDPKFGDQNAIEEYVKLDRKPVAAGGPPPAQDDDEVPF